MRNLIIFTILLIGLPAISQEINTKQWSMVNKKTADWCSLCGSWGWNMHKQLTDRFENKNVLNWALHYSGGLQNQAAVDISANFGGSGQPLFYVEGIDLNATPNNIAAKVAEAEDIVNFTLAQPAYAGIGIEAILSSVTNRLDVKAKVEFLQPVEGGDYYLGLYLVEDSLVAYQQSQGQNAVHRYVLRRSLLNTTWGKSLKKGPLEKGEIFDVDVDLDNITTPRNRLYVAAVIWNKVGNKYLFFNGYQVPVGIPASQLDIHSDLSEIKAYQTEGSEIHLQINSQVSFSNPIIAVTDLNGKTITSLSPGALTEGNHSFQLKGNFIPGLHLITLQDNKYSKTIKLIIH
jgi:hypothetical protein